MKITEIIRWVVGAAAISGLIGFVASFLVAWRFRNDIKRAELRRAAIIIQKRKRTLRNQDCEEKQRSRETELVSAGHAHP